MRERLDWRRRAVGENLQLASPARALNFSSSFTSAWVFSFYFHVLTVSSISSIFVFRDSVLTDSFLSPFRSFLEHILKAILKSLCFTSALRLASHGLLFSAAGLWWRQMLLAVTDYIFTLVSRYLGLELL